MKRHNEKRRTQIKRRISLCLAITFVTSTQGPMFLAMAAPQLFFRPAAGVSRLPLQVGAFDAPGFGEVEDAINLATGNVYVAMDGASRNNILEATTSGGQKKDETTSNLQGGWNLDSRLRLDGFANNLTTATVPPGFFLGSGDGAGTSFQPVTMDATAWTNAPSWIKRYQTSNDLTNTKFYALTKKPGEQFSSEWVVLRTRAGTPATVTFANTFSNPKQLITPDTKNWNAATNISVATPGSVAVDRTLEPDGLLDGFSTNTSSGWMNTKITAIAGKTVAPSIVMQTTSGTVSVNMSIQSLAGVVVNYMSGGVGLYTCVVTTSPTRCTMPTYAVPTGSADLQMAVSIPASSTVYLGGQHSNSFSISSVPSGQTNLISDPNPLLSNAYWGGYFSKPSTLGYQMASSDTGCGNPASGVLRSQTINPGKYQISMEGRTTTGTLAIGYGLDNSASTGATLTTQWQNFNFETTLTATSLRLFQVFENVTTNQPWEVANIIVRKWDGGKYGPNLITDQNLSSTYWSAYCAKPTMTTVDTNRFMSLEPSPNGTPIAQSGMIRYGTSPTPVGDYRVELEGRTLAGTTPVAYGIADGYTNSAVLTNIWQPLQATFRVNPAIGDGRQFQMFKTSFSNASWEIRNLKVFPVTNSFANAGQISLGSLENWKSGGVSSATAGRIAVPSEYDADGVLDGFTATTAGGWVAGKVNNTSGQKISASISGRVADGEAPLALTVRLENNARTAYTSTPTSQTTDTCTFTSTPRTCILAEWTSTSADVYLAVTGIPLGKTVYLGGPDSKTVTSGTVSGAVAHYYAHDGTRTSFRNDGVFADYSQSLHQQLRGVKNNGDPEGEKTACTPDQINTTCTPKTEFIYDAANAGRITKVKDQWGRVTTYEWNTTDGTLTNINYLLRDENQPNSFARRAAFAYSLNDKNGISLGGPRVVSSVTYSTRSGKADGTGTGLINSGSNGKEALIAREFRFAYEKIGTMIAVSRIQRPAVGVTGGFLNTDYVYYNSAASGSTDPAALNGKIKKVSQTNTGLDDITYFYVIGGASADGITNTYGGIMYLVKQGDNTTGKRTAYLFDNLQQLRERKVRDHSKRYDVIGAASNATPTATDFTRAGDLSTKYEYYNSGDSTISNTLTLVNSSNVEKVDITPSTGNFTANGLVVANPATTTVPAGFDPNNTLEGFTSTASGGSLGTKLNAVSGKTISPSIAIKVSSGTATVYLGIQDLNGVHQVTQKTCTVTTTVATCAMSSYAVPNTNTQLKFDVSWGGAQTVYMGGQNSNAFVPGSTPNDPTGSTKAMTYPEGKRVVFSYDQYGNIASQKTFDSPTSTTVFREETWTYDPDNDNRIKTHTIKGASGATSDGVTYSYPDATQSTNYSYHPELTALDGTKFKALQSITNMPDDLMQPGSVVTLDDQGRMTSTSVQSGSDPALRTTTYSYKDAENFSPYLFTSAGTIDEGSRGDPARQYRDLIDTSRTTTSNGTVNGPTRKYNYDAFGNVNEESAIAALRTLNILDGTVDGTLRTFTQTNGFGQTVGTANYSENGYAAIRGWNYASSGELLNSWDGTPANLTQYQYDTFGRVNNIQHGISSTTGTVSIKHEETVIPAGGYDVYNRVIKSQKDGFETITEYDTLDRPTSVLRPDSSRISTQYDVSGGKSMECISGGPATTLDNRACQVMTYDALGRNTTSTQWTAETQYGIIVYNEFDKFDRVIRQTNEALGEMTANALDRATYYAYNKYGQLIKQLDPVLRSQGLSINYSGGSTAITDSRRPYTEIRYDKYGRPILKSVMTKGQLLLSPTVLSSTNHLSSDACTAYSTASISVALTCTMYDELDRAKTIVDPDGYSTTMQFDALGNVTSQTRQVWLAPVTGVTQDFPTVTSSFFYDAAGRTIATTDPRGNTKAVRFNLLGQPLAEKDQRGITTKAYQYTTDGLLERIAEPNTSDGSTVGGWANFTESTAPNGYVVTKFLKYSTRTTPIMTCEAFMNNTEAKESNGKCTTTLMTEIDFAGRPTTTWLPDLKTIIQKFDVFGNVREITDADGFQTKYSYDARGQLRETLKPPRTGNSTDIAAFPIASYAGLRDSYAYDLAGNLKQKIERGLSTEYEYNTLGKVMGEAKAHKIGAATIHKANAYRLDGELLAESIYGTPVGYFNTPADFGNGTSTTPTVGNLTGYKLSPAGKRIEEWSAGTGSGNTLVNGIPTNAAAARLEKTVKTTFDGLGLQHKREFSGHGGVYDAPIGIGGPNYLSFWHYDANNNLTRSWDSLTTDGLQPNNDYTYTYSASNKETSNSRDVRVSEVLPNSAITPVASSTGALAGGKLITASYNERDQKLQTNASDNNTSMTASADTTYTYNYDGSVSRVTVNGSGYKDSQYDFRGRLIETKTYSNTNALTAKVTNDYGLGSGIVETKVFAGVATSPTHITATTPTIGGLSHSTSTQGIALAAISCNPLVEGSTGCSATTTRTYDANGFMVSDSSNESFTYQTRGGAGFPSEYSPGSINTISQYFNDDFGNTYLINRNHTPGNANINLNASWFEAYRAEYNSNTNAAIKETTYAVSLARSQQSQATPGNYLYYSPGYDTSVSQYVLGSRGQRLARAGSTYSPPAPGSPSNNFGIHASLNGQKRYDANDMASSFDESSTGDQNGYKPNEGVTAYAEKTAKFVFFRHDPMGRNVLSGNMILTSRGATTGVWDAALKGRVFSSASIDGAVQLMMDRQPCSLQSYYAQAPSSPLVYFNSYEDCAGAAWRAQGDPFTRTNTTTFNVIIATRNDTYNMLNSLYERSSSSVLETIQPFGVGTPETAPLEAPTTALSTATRVDPTAIEAPGSTPSTDSPSSNIEAPSKDQPVTAKDQPTSSTPAFSSGANLNANALSPSVSTPAFGVTSFTINPNTLTPIAPGSNAPSTNAESTPAFSTEFSLEAPVSVLPPAISSFSVTSIVNPLEDLGFIPSLGSVSDINAPGITAPGTVSTPSSGAGGITAPSDSSAGVPELPRIESPNGNASSVVAPVGTDQSKVNTLDIRNTTTGECILSWWGGWGDGCKLADDLNEKRRLEQLANNNAVGATQKDVAQTELLLLGLAAAQDSKGESREARIQLELLLNSKWYKDKAKDPVGQMQALLAIKKGFESGSIGGSDLRDLNATVAEFDRKCGFDAGKLYCGPGSAKFNNAYSQWALETGSVVLGFTPIGDALSVYSAISGFDPITGKQVEGFERWVGLLGLIGLGGEIRAAKGIGTIGKYGRESLGAIDRAFDVGKGLVSCFKKNSFSADTKVLTRKGFTAIAKLSVGDKVLAYDEETGKTLESQIQDTISHTDPETILLTISADQKTEVLETTRDHPFFTVKLVDNKPRPKPDGHEDLSSYWVGAGDLKPGDTVLRANGLVGTVKNIQVIGKTQQMYNLSVEGAHTYFVGDGKFLVHNCGEAFAYTAKTLLNQLPTEFRKATIGYGIDARGNPIISIFVGGPNGEELTNQAYKWLRDRGYNVVPSPGGAHAEVELYKSGVRGDIGISNSYVCEACDRFFSNLSDTKITASPKSSATSFPWLPPR